MMLTGSRAVGQAAVVACTVMVLGASCARSAQAPDSGSSTVASASAPMASMSPSAAGSGSSSAPSASSGPSLPAADAPHVGVVLPTDADGTRWESLDRPALEQAFAAKGIPVDIRNAKGDPGQMAALATDLVDSGVKALVVASIDDAAGAAAIGVAQQRGIPVIDLDHLTNGGRANYFVGPDPGASGQLLGDGLLRCMRDNGNEHGPVALVNGPANDTTAMAMKQAYQQAVIGGGYVIRATEDVPNWNPGSAGALFERMYTMSNGDLVGVIGASDALAAAAIDVLDRNGQANKVPVAGTGSSPQALERILLGTQCMTVMTAVTTEASAVADLATAIVTSDGGTVAALAAGRLTDGASGVEVPSVLLTPQAVRAGDIPALVASGIVPASVLCRSPAAHQACIDHGIPD